MRCSNCGRPLEMRGAVDQVEFTTTMVVESDGTTTVTDESEKCSECLLIEEAERIG